MARFGYGKIGRSMPLTLDRCANLGGDVEMVAVVKTLALRHPEHTFVLVGRNDGSVPAEVGLPPNVENPWIGWAPVLRRTRAERDLNHGNLTIEDHGRMRDVFDELTLDTFTGLDGIVLWAGQHGTTNTPLPRVKRSDELTKPQDWCAHYSSFLLRGVNVWRDVDPLEREEVWLNADPRNYLKMRDLKWPMRHPVLTQYTFDHNIKHERYGDGRLFNDFYVPGECDVAEEGMHTSDVWRSRLRNVYARLEINGMMPGTPFGNLISYSDSWEDRGHFGLFINEARRYVRDDVARVNVMLEWVLPLEPTWIHGTWSDDSLARFESWGYGHGGRPIRPAPWNLYYPRLHSVRSTFTTPSSGSAWATAKPWEAFAAGTVCFFHPGYDAQDNVLGDAPDGLREWLRVGSPGELELRVRHLNTAAGRADWEWIVRAQRRHFDAALTDLRYVKMIERRLGIGGTE